MEAKLNKTSLDCYHKVFSQKLRKEETQDMVVPDTMPDIDYILDTSGCILLRSKDIAGGRVRLEANIMSKIAYLPEGEQSPRCLELSFPVSINVENEIISEELTCKAEINLLSLDTRVLNPRKILVKAEMCVDMVCWQRDGLELCSSLEDNPCKANVKQERCIINPCVCVSEKTFVVADEYMIPASKPTLASVVGQRTELLVEDTKFVGSKLVIKGCVKSKLLYCSDEGKTVALEFITGLSQIMEVCELGENPFAELSLMLTGAYYDVVPDNEGHRINMELHLLAQAAVRDSVELEYLADAYSNLYMLNIERETTEEVSVRQIGEIRDIMRETVELPQQVQDVLDAQAICGAARQEGDKIILPVTVSILYIANDGKPYSLNRRLETSIDAATEENERAEILGIYTGELYAVANGSNIDLRLPINLRSAVVCDAAIYSISAINADEEEILDVSAKPSITLLMAGSDSDLWKLARENCSTVEAIKSVNSIEDGSVWKKYILIPKVV